MHEDDENDEDREPRIEFTDEEWAFLRYARFGELPQRVPPEDLVELTETEPSGGYRAPSADQWRDLRAGGA